MSLWTHIVGVIHVETYIQKDDIKSYVEEKLKDAPKITGSEGDADVFVNPQSGHSMWTSCDCARCKYGDTVKYHDGYQECDSPEGFRCESGEYQTRVIITVCGDLRDRSKEETQKEWNEFYRYVKEELKFTVRISSCDIAGL